MGFGSYDEGEQERMENAEQEDTGQKVTNEFKSKTHDGKEKTTDTSTADMMKHL